MLPGLDWVHYGQAGSQYGKSQGSEVSAVGITGITGVHSLERGKGQSIGLGSGRQSPGEAFGSDEA